MSESRQSPGGFFANMKEIRRRVSAHNVVVTSAGIAFYALLALVPTLIATVSIYGLVTDPADIARQVSDYAGSLDEETQTLITDQLEDIVGGVEADSADADQDESIAGTIGRVGGLVFGIALALFAASGAVQKLIATIAIAYETIDTRPGWKQRLVAYLFTTASIVGVGLISFILAVLPAILDRADLGGTAENAITILQLPAVALLFVAGLSVLYRYGPGRRPRTPWVNPGAIVGTVLFVIFAIGLSIYTSRVGDMPASYGLLGSIAVLMIFLQLTALAVIIGAEVNGAIEVGSLAEASATRLSTTSLATAQSASGTAVGGSALVPISRTGGMTSVQTIGQPPEPEEPKPLSFGKALAGLAVLAALGRAAGSQD